MPCHDTIERALGRWREILPQLGVETRFLTNKQGPCPLCGGRDRFRFDDKDGRGTYYCNQCGPGIGLTLVRKLHGWDFRTAVDAIDKIIGYGLPKPAIETQSESQKDDSSKRLHAIERLLDGAKSPEVVTAYLLSRGIDVPCPVLRGHVSCPYYNSNGKLVGEFPCVIAPVVGPNGSLQSAQRIYVGPVDPRRKTMPPVETMNGAAVRLQTPTETLGVAEGVETAFWQHRCCSAFLHGPQYPPTASKPLSLLRMCTSCISSPTTTRPLPAKLRPMCSPNGSGATGRSLPSRFTFRHRSRPITTTCYEDARE